MRSIGLLLFAAACGRTTLLDSELSSNVDSGGVDATSGDAPLPTGSTTLELAPSRACIGRNSSVTLSVRVERFGTAVGADIPIVVDAAEEFEVTPLTLLSTQETGSITITPTPDVSEGQHQLSFHALDATRTVEIHVGPAAGNLDTSFGTNGVISEKSELQTRVQLALDDHGILVGNSSPALSAVLRRYDETGALDPSFAAAGVLALDYELAALGIAKNGKILVAPEGPAASQPAYLVFPPDGSNPVAMAPLSSSPQVVRAACIFENEVDDVLLTGLILDCCGFAARFLAGTSFDNVYWSNAKAAIPGSGYACAAAPGDRVVHAGYQGMVRLLPDGNLDTKYSSVTYRALSVGDDGRVVAASNASIDSYSAAGTPDADFGGNGQYAMGVQAVVIDRDGAVVALDQNKLVRLTRQGSLDTAFTSSTLELESGVLALDTCGRIVVAGIAQSSNLEVRRFWP